MECRKRGAEKVSFLNGIKAVLLDIEGTTTPISFVKDKLFPYVKENIRSYVEKNFGSDELQEDVDSLRSQALADIESGIEGAVAIPDKDADKKLIVDAVVANVLWQMESDRKTTSLKQLQGHVWDEAYRSGSILGEIFDDVLPAIKSLIAQETKVYIYSSGSIAAQKLLFGHSNKGDLRKFLSGYFDTTIGAKVDPESYTKIAKQLEEDPETILFLTDLHREAEAAKSAGLRASIVVRDGNAPLSDPDKESFSILHSFDELFEGGGSDSKQKTQVSDECILSSNSEDSEDDDDEVVVISGNDSDED